MKTSEILRKTKRHISKVHNSPICYALIYVNDAPMEKRIKIERMISKRLNGWAFAHTWLGAVMVSGNPNPKYDNDLYYRAKTWVTQQSIRKLQAWRHAWVDQLIAEFEAKGD